jgi:hypothetical protein
MWCPCNPVTRDRIRLDVCERTGFRACSGFSRITGYGHYEDEMVKVDGQWLFNKRVIYNEGVADWIASSEKPAW